MPPTCVVVPVPSAATTAARRSVQSAQGAKLNSRKIPFDGVSIEDAVIAMTMSRSFTSACMLPQEPMRISVLAP